MLVTCAETAEFLASPDFEAVVGSHAKAFHAMWTRALHKCGDKEHMPPQTGAIWWMLLIGPLWLAYRRLYRQFWLWLGIFVASCLVDIVAPYETVNLLNNAFMLGINVAFMSYGGRWYLEHCLRVYQQGKGMGDAAERAAWRRREGGVNWLAVALALVIVAGLVVGLGMLMPEVMYY